MESDEKHGESESEGKEAFSLTDPMKSQLREMGFELDICRIRNAMISASHSLSGLCHKDVKTHSCARTKLGTPKYVHTRTYWQ